MKKILILSIALLSRLGFSQELSYEIRSTHARCIKQEALRSPKRLSDLIACYPANWISSYRSVEISVSHHGKEQTAISATDSLSMEQLEILNHASLSASISIRVNYDYRVPVTHVMEHNTMLAEMTIVPQHEAQYPGGQKKLIQYLKENSPPAPAAKSGERQQLIIRFSIDEQGKVSHPEIRHSFGDTETDKQFLKLIQNMPDWKTAETPEGQKVSQEFEFIAGRGGGC